MSPYSVVSTKQNNPYILINDRFTNELFNLLAQIQLERSSKFISHLNHFKNDFDSFPD